MFLLFSLLLLVLAMGILSSVYSVFFPFIQNLGTVNQYYTAYYGAISAVERAELALRYRGPGFEGSGGFTGSGYSFGPASDYSSDIISGSKQGFWRTINSRTSKIPEVGMGNVDPMLSAIDSKNFNQLGYINQEIFLLYYDSTIDTGLYYTGSSTLSFFTGQTITGIFRLPPKIYSGFGGDSNAFLCTTLGQDNCDPTGNHVYDDIILAWSMKGFYQGNDFTIYPIDSVSYIGDNPQITPEKDSFIRESIINGGGIVTIDDSYEHKFSPIANGSLLTGHQVVSSAASEINSIRFASLFSNTEFTGLSLTFGADKFFRANNDAIYPYLEYQFTFAQPIANRFFDIQGNGRAGEYDVQILIKKPTAQGSVGSDFTVRF